MPRGLIRRDEGLVLAVVALSVVACLLTGTGFTALSIVHAYAQFLALQYMLIFIISRYAFRFRSQRAGSVLGRVGNYADLEALRDTDYELARGGLVLLCALTAYTNLKVRVPVLNNSMHDASLAAFDRLFSSDNFVGFAASVRALPALDQLLQRVYLQDYLFVAFAALLLHLRGGARGVRWFFAASALVYLFGIWLTVAWPTFGPCFVDAKNWSWLQSHPIGRFQGTLARDMMRTLQTVSAGAPLEARAFSGVAAFPSLHVGHMAVVAFICARTPGLRWYTLVVAVGIALTGMATVAFGWHYLADTFGGILVAALAVWLSQRLMRDPQPA